MKPQYTSFPSSHKGTEIILLKSKEKKIGEGELYMQAVFVMHNPIHFDQTRGQ